MISSTNSLLSSHPNLLVGFLSALIGCCWRVPQLDLPGLELVLATISLTREKIKSPVVLGTCNAGTERNAEILDIKEVSLRKRE